MNQCVEQGTREEAHGTRDHVLSDADDAPGRTLTDIDGYVGLTHRPSTGFQEEVARRNQFQNGCRVVDEQRPDANGVVQHAAG